MTKGLSLNEPTQQRVRRLAESPVLRSVLSCVLVCAARSVAGARPPSKAPNTKSCCG